MPKAHRCAAALVGIACFALYAAAAAPSLDWLDSGELASASFELGVAHPPGHPIAALLGKACALVPLGAVGLRAGLASAAMGALAAALTALLGAELARRIGEALGRTDERLEAIAGAGSGLCVGLSFALGFQSVRPEVYALHAALVVGAALSLARFDASGDRRALRLAALLVGLALANHHLLALAFALAALAFLAARGRPGRAAWIVVGAGAVGLLAYLYLPLRALRHPAVDWGAPSTVDRFLWTVSARVFQHRSLLRAQGSSPAALAATLAAELGAGAPLGALGLWLLARLPATRRLALLVGGAAILDALAAALVGFDPTNPDAHGYLAPAVALLAAAAAAPVAALGSLVRRPRVGRVAAAACALLLGGVAARAVPSLWRARFHDADRIAGALLDGAPPRAALVTSRFQSAFTLYYLRGVEGRRPDVEHLHRPFLDLPGYRDEALRRAPSLGAIASPGVGPLLDAAATRAVLLEPDAALDGDPAFLAHLAPGALVDRVAAAPLSVGERAAAEDAAWAARTRIERDLDLGDPQTLRAVLAIDQAAAARDCALGRLASARRAIDHARRLLGVEDPELEAFGRRCGAR